MSQVQLSPVRFHDSTLYIVNVSGEPFTPMKPIVEGMGLTWQSQAAKLSTNKERWGITIIVIPTSSGDQEALCMPVRKLPAFMASINPKKVSTELRPTIELYQNECDNALWDYWTKGQATRQPATNGNQLPDTPVTPDQQCTLQAIVRAKVEAIPEAERSKGLYPQIWGRFKNHFRVSKYDQLPQSRMSEAVAYLTQMDVQQKALPPTAELPARYNTPEAIETSLDIIRGQLFDKTVTFMHDMEEIARQARASFSDPKRVSNVGNEFDIFLSEQTQIISSLAEQAYHCGSLASRHIASLKLFAPRIKKIFG